MNQHIRGVVSMRISRGILSLVFLGVLYAAFENRNQIESILPEHWGTSGWQAGAIELIHTQMPFLNIAQLELHHAGRGKSASIRISAAGDRRYSETLFRLYYSISMRNHFIQGIQLHHYRVSVGDYGQFNGTSLGFRSELTPMSRMRLRMQFDDIIRDKTNLLMQNIPSIISIAIRYDLSQVHQVELKLDHEVSHPVSQLYSWMIQPWDHVRMRLGFSTYPQEFLVSGSLKIRSYRIFSGAVLNSVLGPFIIVGVQYE